MQSSPRIAVVIPLFNGAPYIGACIESLTAQTLKPADIIVVDDASTDDGAQIAAGSAQVRVIRQPANFGYAHTVNAGIQTARRASRDGVILLLNQDTVLEPGCLSALQSAFNADPRLGIAGCKIHYPDRKTLQHAGGYLDRPSGMARHHGQGEIDQGQFDARAQPEFVTGAALAVSNRALDALGGMDESISRAYFEDIDLCFRARAAGFHVSYEPAAMLSHLEGSAISSNSYAQALNYHTGRVQFVLRHWPAAQLVAFIEGERAANANSPTIDNALACARACMRAAQSLNETIARRQRIYGRNLDEGCGPDYWAGILHGLLEVHETAMQHVLAMAREAGEWPAKNTMPSLAIASPLDPQLQEFTFTSSVPLIGGLIAWARKSLHSVAGKWALRHVTEQQTAINRQMFGQMEALHLRILELALENRDRVEQQSAVRHEDPNQAQSI